ncbi:hypothetical protein EYC80_009066 [Monilinia laxa]|uniref:Uncharacterized protein n=1 Tax=Monilinia laxa TaxID=61186 RepID=A0A5N6K2N0_MONLA|nr:hypothetical protein EYC80_009066 [Monilinia laxa]
MHVCLSVRIRLGTGRHIHIHININIHPIPSHPHSSLFPPPLLPFLNPVSIFQHPSYPHSTFNIQHSTYWEGNALKSKT